MRPARRSRAASTGLYDNTARAVEMMLDTAVLAPAVLGGLTSPPTIVAVLLVILVILFVGRIIMGVAWKLVLIALAVVVGLWLLGVLGSVMNVLG